MVSNETSSSETQLKPRPPLFGRRIQVVGHAGAGKVNYFVKPTPFEYEN